MNLSQLQNSAPWDWPDDAKDMVLEGLKDNEDNPGRLLAAQLAGDPCVIDDEIAQLLLEMLSNKALSENLRAQAAISLGPALELTGDDLPDPDSGSPISEKIFEGAKADLRKAFLDPSNPKGVRRNILEASVRSPEDWHRKAIKDAYLTGDQEWKLTAVFAMRWVSGFEQEILASLNDPTNEVRYEAVCAAGNWELDAAWPTIIKLATSKDTEKRFLMAAIEAAYSIRPEDAGPMLAHLADSDDEDVGMLIHECMAMANPELEEEMDLHEEEAEEELKEWLEEQEQKGS